MNKKHFVVTPEATPISKEEIKQIEQRKQGVVKNMWERREQETKLAMSSNSPLKHTCGRVIVKVDLEAKNWHTFQDGTKIRRERQFNEFNRRVTQPTNAIVVSGDGIPAGSEILISHNSLHDTNKIFDLETESKDVFYFSIPEYDCYAWRVIGQPFQPMKNFDFGLRVFKPYKGFIEGIEPTIIPDVIYVTTGEFKGYVVNTLKACDYEIIYQNDDGRESSLIRFRHSSDPQFDREEIAAISNYLTDKVKNNELLIGISVKDCKTFHDSH